MVRHIIGQLLLKTIMNKAPFYVHVSDQVLLISRHQIIDE